ncbi:hypothetical protein BOTBODRAFT_424357 [Botryobasidium botryosum FD-172 SS1]|uniref:Protein kinase domain-containing protein n=1 Tax=Botryobasidium botryosum (strain FD-172 SS1) TaxID=930990 RepID=A0A067MJP3_BOTB1|nr:hypothetical protein BOTBODRAFT_424357 [Botryobasidium botryosum FD-172 SS1]
MPASSLPARGETSLSDHYLVGRVLRRDKFDVVLEGWDRETDEKVEIKYVEGHSISLKDSKEELMVNLRHPNLLNYKARYEEDDGVYYVREHADGGNLKDLFSTHQGTTPCKSEEKIKYLAYQICLGLRYAHSQGVIHCDQTREYPANEEWASKNIGLLSLEGRVERSGLEVEGVSNRNVGI